MALATLKTTFARSSRTFLWCATGCGLFVLLCFFAAVAYSLYLSTLETNRQAASNIAALIEQGIERDFELYDLSLLWLLQGIGDPDVMGQTPVLRHRALFDRTATAHGMTALVALDETGAIVQDSLGVVPRTGNFADREYFQVHRDAGTDIDFYVSRPVRARLENDIWAFTVSRRITRLDGSFGGIVSGVIRLDYFRELFRRVGLGRNGTVNLYRTDGILMTGNATPDAMIGADRSDLPLFKRLAERSQGDLLVKSTHDGVWRLYAFQRVGALPLVVTVGISLGTMLGTMWPKVFLLAAIFLGMAASVVTLVCLLDMELRRRELAESEAASLARTDGLTGLANRRQFDERLRNEWARNAREGSPLSLIMIDTDYFKNFNDTYGHQAGDRALVAVSDAIKAVARRPGDLAARYGGEEFAILLANTDADSALGIANALREKVAALAIRNSRSTYGILTLSLGVATVVPSAREEPELLVREADAALYRAKDHGRDAVVASHMRPAPPAAQKAAPALERQAG